MKNKASVLSDKNKKLLLIDPELFSIFEQVEKNICLFICRLHDAYITVISVSEYLEGKKKWYSARWQRDFYEIKEHWFPSAWEHLWLENK